MEDDDDDDEEAGKVKSITENPSDICNASNKLSYVERVWNISCFESVCV